MKACAEYGREDVDSICKEVEGKSEEEVRRDVHVLCTCIDNVVHVHDLNCHLWARFLISLIILSTQ